MNVLISRIDIGSNGWLEPKSFSGWLLPPCAEVLTLFFSLQCLGLGEETCPLAGDGTCQQTNTRQMLRNQVFALLIPRLIILDSIFSLNPVVHHSCIANEHTQTLEQPTGCLRHCCERPPVWRGYWAERFGGEGQGPLQSTSCAWKPTSTQEDFRFLGIFSDFFFWDDQFLNVFQISKQSHLYDTFKWRWMNVLHELHLWIDKDPTGKSKSLIPRVSAAVSAKVCTGWKAFHCQMWRLASVPRPNGLVQLCSMAVSRFC